MKNNVIVILAAGLGKRMNTDIPKVLIHFLGEPMLVKLLRNINDLNQPNIKILIVVGKFKKIIIETLLKYNVLSDNIVLIDQKQALGTGHAVLCCHNYLSNIDKESNVLILYGDTPLINKKIINNIFNINLIKIITTELDNPYGFGRILYNRDNKIIDIREEKDTNFEESLIKTVNCGIYCIKNSLLCKYVQLIDNNNSNCEYYLTDIINLIVNREKISIEELKLDSDENLNVLGVNTKEQLKNLEKLYIQSHLNT